MFGLTIPEEYGGLRESLLTYALAVEEIARGWMGISGIVNTHFIVAYMLLQHGTEEQKRKYLPRMATGEVRGEFSMSEPGCGSDVSAIRTERAGCERPHKSMVAPETYPIRVVIRDEMADGQFDGFAIGAEVQSIDT